MGLIEATADIDVARDAITTATTLEELKQQLADNLFPVIKGIAEATANELVAFTEVIKTITDDIDDLREGEGELLYPETTQKINSVLDTGATIANELEAILAKTDQVTRKRCKALIESYRQGKNVVIDALVSITMPVDPEEVDDDASGPIVLHADDLDDNDDDDDDAEEGEAPDENDEAVK